MAIHMQVFESMGKGLAVMSMDQEYVCASVGSTCSP